MKRLLLRVLRWFRPVADHADPMDFDWTTKERFAPREQRCIAAQHIESWRERAEVDEFAKAPNDCDWGTLDVSTRSKAEQASVDHHNAARTRWPHLMSVLLLVLCVSAPAIAQRDDSKPNITAGKFYLTVVISNPPTDAGLHLLDSLKTNPQLKALTEQTVYHLWTEDSPKMGARWRAYLGDKYPVLLLQSPADGFGRAHVLYATRAAESMYNSAKLISNIATAINNYRLETGRQYTIHQEWEPMEQCGPGGCRPWRPRQPQPAPRPAPAPAPEPDVAPPLPEPIFPNIAIEIPDVVEVEIPAAPEVSSDIKEQTADEGFQIPLVLMLLPLAATGIGMWAGLRRAKR